MSDEVEKALIALVSELRRPGDGVRWLRPDNLHVTLRFLGAAAESRKLVLLDSRLRNLAARTLAFTVNLRGLGAFPELDRPRVIWAGLEGEDLLTLARGVEETAIQSGFEAEERPYAPHLTIGRLGNLKNWANLRKTVEANAKHEFGSSQIDTLTLYRSILAPSGAIHQVIGSYPMAARPG